MSRFEFERLAVPDVIVIKPAVFGDARGFFSETYRKNEFAEVGITEDFVQDNHSRSGARILRGLHFQIVPQAKIVRAATGRIFDVAADLRPGSPTFRKWVGTELSDENMHQLYVPPGFAHGFVVVGDSADVCYKVGPTYYVDDTERGIRWDDPDVGVDWPVGDPLTSERDRTAPSLADIEPQLVSWFGDLGRG
ncbi:MAG: dTDP-4-dehydrorhamnose 3,5-epimerase [Acidimicrobiia bacterium]|nr:dTDP-4-dehydrorhamnose 3,5-epimerase [Acidimicrobiia bacterium]